MKLNINKKIENNIITVDISVTELGTSTSTQIEEVKLDNIINKEYPINKDMNIVMTFDVAKIPASALNTVFDTVEKLGKAYAELFSVKIQQEIGKKLTELRSLNTKFEGETEVVL